MDLVGEASARLLAAGFPRDDRLGSLRLLGVLLTVAGPTGVVHRDVRQLASEFGLPPSDSERWLSQLASTGAIHVGEGTVVLAGPDDGDATGLRLDEFLAVVADLDERRRRRRGLARPVGAAVTAVAAGLAGLVLLPAAFDGPATPVLTDRPQIEVPTTTGVDSRDGSSGPTDGERPAPPVSGDTGTGPQPTTPPATAPAGAGEPVDPAAPPPPPGGEQTCTTVIGLDGVPTSVPPSDGPVPCLDP